MKRSFTFPPVNSVRSSTHATRGIALLIVVSVLAVVLILVISFGLSMILETRAANQFAATTQARYIAEAGVQHARAVLDEDQLGTRLDDLNEAWGSQFSGADVDVDDDHTPEARWIPLVDHTEHAGGHYGVLIMDEASKANLNMAVADPEASDVDAVNLTMLLSQAGIANATGVAQTIETFRYGIDGKPGVALVDDDHDGDVDEAAEYDPLALHGDDRRIDVMEELQGISGVNAEELTQLSRVATVYTWDPNISITGQPRVNINTATATELLVLLLQIGAQHPWQLATNIADDVDSDLELSRVSKTAQFYAIPDQGAIGDWSWSSSSYRTTVVDGQPLTWTVPIPSSGSFYLLVHGVPGMKVGDVTLAGQTKTSMDSDDAFGLVDVGNLSGNLTVQIVNRESAGTSCAFAGIELAATEPTAGFSTITVRGIEPIRINELMVKPTAEFGAQEAAFDKPQGSSWACVDGACSNSATGQATWTWQTDLPAGLYYLRVYGTQSGQVVGAIALTGQAHLLVHGQRHPDPVVIGADGSVSVTIAKTAPNETYYFQKVALSVEPDGEYLELINLSNQPVDLTGWVIEGEATGGKQAKFPTGARIAAHGYLVALVDAEDQAEALEANGISAAGAWWEGAISADTPWVQLEFPGGSPTPDDDWLKTTLTESSARLVLKSNQGWIVDEVEYPLSPPPTGTMQSLEKGDPTVVGDADQDGIDDEWYPSLNLWTPGAPNNNSGLQEFQGAQLIVHNPAQEITLANHLLATVGELVGVPSGSAWTVVASADVARVVDRVTVQGIRLEAEDQLLSGNWDEVTDGYQTTQRFSVGTWKWVAVPPGPYRLSVYGWSGDQIAIRWKQPGGTYATWSPPLSADAQGRVVVGQVTIAEFPDPVADTLTVEVRCESLSGVCHLNHVWLDPNLVLTGLLNINTAPQEVLMSLPGMTSGVAQALMAGRPFGDQDGKARGIGDLLLGTILGQTEEDKLNRFRAWAHLITVRSQVFRIMSLGESMEGANVSAQQRIETVMQR